MTRYTAHWWQGPGAKAERKVKWLLIVVVAAVPAAIVWGICK